LTSLIPRADIYDPKTLAVVDQAFTAIWNVLRADALFRDYATDSKPRIAIGQKLPCGGGRNRPCSAAKSYRGKFACLTSLRSVVLNRTRIQRSPSNEKIHLLSYDRRLVRLNRDNRFHAR
jgi:hypothetical protein